MAIYELKAMLPGIFYTRSAPDQPVFVQTGDQITTGQTVGLIEVMKSFHEVTSDTDGRLVEVCAENEQAIMPGQTLFRIDTD